MTNKTAALLIIGNEILSGRTQDKNLNYIANKLNDIGIKFAEARVVLDIHEDISHAVNELRTKYDYLFTTGGIGPTHDDITTESVAAAFNLPVIRNEYAQKLLEDYYKDRDAELNEARLRMANTPEGAELIENPLTAAPGYKIDNVFVLAGIPNIMKMMFDYASQYLEGGSKMFSASVSCDLVEGDIAEKLSEIQQKYNNTEIGSYPFIKDGKYSVSAVVRSIDEKTVEVVAEEIREFILQKGGAIIEK